MTAPKVNRADLGSFLTPRNRVNAATGIRFRRQYKDLRALTEEEERTAGKICLAGKRVRAVKRALQRAGAEPSEEQWAAACKLDVSTLRQYIALSATARNRLVQHNMRLAEYWVSKLVAYSGLARDIPYIDLMAEATVGLTRAAESYNGGSRFGPYATVWIRSELYRGLTRLRPDNLASHQRMMTMYRIKKAEHELGLLLERRPTDEEVAAHLRMRLDNLRAVRAAVDARIISAETKLGGADGEGADSYKDLLPRAEAENFGAETAVWRAQFQQALEVLTPFERRTVSLRFGLLDGAPKGVGTTAALMAISPEAVRQTVHRSFEKLRASPFADVLANGPPPTASVTTIGKVSARAY